MPVLNVGAGVHLFNDEIKKNLENLMKTYNMTCKEQLEKKGYEIDKDLIDDDLYRLLRNDNIVFDDSAYEDFYGEEEEVAQVFVSMLAETWKEESKVEQALRAYAAEHDDALTIVDSIDLPEEAKLYVFKGTGYQSCAVVHADGTIFVLDDWQSNDYPEDFEWIEDYEWYTLDGRMAVVMNGLPRVFA